MGHKCKVRSPRPSRRDSPHPASTFAKSHLLLQRCAPSAQSSTLYRQELKRKLESAEDSDIVEQGRAIINGGPSELVSRA